MKLFCRSCKAVVVRHKRDWLRYKKKRGYKSWCDNQQKMVWLVPLIKEER